MKTPDETVQQTRRYLRDLVKRIKKAQRAVNKKQDALLQKCLLNVRALDEKVPSLESAARTLDAMIEKAPTQPRYLLQLQLATLRGLICQCKQNLELRI
ncbi:hypothetical protein ACJZ2D_006571 [Fusarium nematophilum]